MRNVEIVVQLIVFNLCCISSFRFLVFFCSVLGFSGNGRVSHLRDRNTNFKPLQLFVMKGWTRTLTSNVRPTELWLLSGDPSSSLSRVSIWKSPKHSIKATCPAGTGTLSSAAEGGNAKLAKQKKIKAASALHMERQNPPGPGYQNLLAETLRAHSIDIACLQETRIPDQGHTILSARNPEAQDILIPLYKLLFSSATKNTVHHCVGIAVSMKMQALIVIWLPVSPRICAIQLDTKPCRTTIVCAYAPTEDACTEIKDDFYDSLRQNIEKVGKNTIVLIEGDFNAKVGQPNDSKNCLGKFSIRERNNNGKRLCTFASLENLVLSSTTFQKRRWQLVTWHSNDKVTKNQFDHILINRRWRSAVNNIQVRGDKLYLCSDHRPVIGTICAKFKLFNKKDSSKRFNVKCWTANPNVPATSRNSAINSGKFQIATIWTLSGGAWNRQ